MDEELEELIKPVMEYLYRNCGIDEKLIIDFESAELVKIEKRVTDKIHFDFTEK